MEKLKVAVIGVGNISAFHISGYLSNENVELVALCDINKEVLEKKGKLYNITKLFTSVDEMFSAMPEIDMVSVCTWNSAHAECAIKALNAKKHVLCEKPMATTVKDAEAMNEAAKRNGKKLMVGFVKRFAKSTNIIKEFIKKDDLGKVYFAKAQNLRRNGNPGGWFSDISRSGGGPLIDLGVHDIDLVRYLVGNPLPVAVYGATFYELGDRKDVKDSAGYVATSSDKANDKCSVEDLALALIRFNNGMVLSVETSFSLNIKENTSGVQLFGNKAGVKIGSQVEIFNNTNGYMSNLTFDTNTEFDMVNSFKNEINHFVDVVKNDAPLIATAEDGVALMKILSAIYESAKTQSEIKIKE